MLALLMVLLALGNGPLLCAGCGMAGMDLHGQNLQGAKWAGSDLRGANLSHANLSSSRLAGVNFDDANMQYVDLHGALIAGATFRNADMRHADLSGATLCVREDRGISCNDFTGAALQGATLRGALICDSGNGRHCSTVDAATLERYGHARLQGATL